MKKFVQLQNPRTKRYIKVDCTNGIIVSSKKTPYKNVEIIKGKKPDDEV